MGLKIIMILVIIGSFVSGGERISKQMQAVYNACDNNIATACFELGELYREGVGVDSDLSIAKAYYIKACDGGFDQACFKLEKLQEQSSNEN